MNGEDVEGIAADLMGTTAESLACVLISRDGNEKGDHSFKPRLHRAAIMRPIRGIKSKSWGHLFTYGRAPDFIVFIKFTRSCFEGLLVSEFETMRMTANLGSPYRTKAKTKGRNLQLYSVGLIDFALYYLK